jgi:hypothetical protein
MISLRIHYMWTGGLLLCCVISGVVVVGIAAPLSLKGRHWRPNRLGNVSGFSCASPII